VSDDDEPGLLSGAEIMRRYRAQIDADLNRSMGDPYGRTEVERAAKILGRTCRGPTGDIKKPLPTALAAAIIARAPAAVAKMRRDRMRLTIKSLAQELEVDRDTLSRWIRLGWFLWPPD
jgi:hypothetical protein